ncbi:hypothetical protein [Enterobacter ludwigii]|uniref:hypothetical protein n=1 Tax=Enterobacter ludwigii TaxID=299767 RepID=UPI000642F683|nr:hypothetical protein [Enterobacter ludwigii]KLP39507.1 hypothetical protein ABR36_10880 [Enterobacter ludwigii]
MHNAICMTKLNGLADEAHQAALRMKTLLGMWQNEFGEPESGSKTEVLVGMLLDLANEMLPVTAAIEKATEEPRQE